MKIGQRSEITYREPIRDGFGSTRTWHRTIGGVRYSFTAILMPNGERRYSASKLVGSDARFACNWKPCLWYVIPA